MQDRQELLPAPVRAASRNLVGRFVFAILHHGDERDLGEAILPAAEAPELAQLPQFEGSVLGFSTT
jgi:hypothetical protein